MVTFNENGLVRVTVTLEREDVFLLDALARAEGLNRSSELRSLLEQVRPMMRQLVATFVTAEGQRAKLNEAMLNATLSELQAIEPELEDMNRKFLGAMAKLEGHAAASGGDAPASNTGATQ